MEEKEIQELIFSNEAADWFRNNSNCDQQDIDNHLNALGNDPRFQLITDEFRIDIYDLSFHRALLLNKEKVSDIIKQVQDLGYPPVTITQMETLLRKVNL